MINNHYFKSFLILKTNINLRNKLIDIKKLLVIKY